MSFPFTLEALDLYDKLLYIFCGLFLICQGLQFPKPFCFASAVFDMADNLCDPGGL